MSKKLILGITVISCLIGVLGCVCEPCSEGQKNKELVADAFAAINALELDKLDQWIAHDYVRHCQATPDFNVTSLEDFKAYLMSELGSVSKPEMVIHRMVAEDDLVAFWATYTGIQDGPIGPFPATGKRMELDFSGMHRIADGKIVETWVTWDTLTALTQLGLYPSAPEIDTTE
ncbi:MAG: ester cyclase [Acidobacteria bacterium]|jgi:predicted ester cyclase|nr:ester cyclase [Acidobacteriota bacterium]